MDNKNIDYSTAFMMLIVLSFFSYVNDFTEGCTRSRIEKHLEEINEKTRVDTVYLYTPPQKSQ